MAIPGDSRYSAEPPFTQPGKALQAMPVKLYSAFNLFANTREIFSRPTARFAQIDGLRALSILLVYVYHCMIAVMLCFKSQYAEFVHQTPWYWQWVLLGERGVDVFFVISGFLIGQILFKESHASGKVNFRLFFIRRWLRLTPAYYLVILLAWFFGPWEDKSWLWAFVFYVSNFLPVEYNYIHYAWSLPIEEQFYLLFALALGLGFFRLQHPRRWLLALLALSPLVQASLFLLNPQILVPGDQLLAGNEQVMADYWEIIYDNLYTRYGALVVGVLLAHLYVFDWPRMQQWATVGRCNLLASLAMATLVVLMCVPVFDGTVHPDWLLLAYHALHRDLFAIAIALLVFVGMQPHGWGKVLGQVLSWRGFFPISQLSYAMYLVNLPILVMVAVMLRNVGLVDSLSYGNVLVMFVAAFLPMMLVSGLLHILVEKPFMKLRP